MLHAKDRFTFFLGCCESHEIDIIIVHDPDLLEVLYITQSDSDGQLK